MPKSPCVVNFVEAEPISVLTRRVGAAFLLKCDGTRAHTCVQTCVPVCDGWHKMLTCLASCANRHKPGPGNIMQPPGTKVDQVGTARVSLLMSHQLSSPVVRYQPAQLWYQGGKLAPTLLSFGTRGLHNIPRARFVTVGARCSLV